MKKTLIVISGMFLLLIVSCSSRQSLQEYYVSNSENPNFISLDVPASILNLQSNSLTETQREGLESLRKLNVLAFRVTEDNKAEFQTEKTRVNAILNNDKYIELMKLNSQYGKGAIKYLGDADAIDEVIIYGSSEDKGFAIIRVLGKNMNPTQLVQLMGAIQNSDFDTAELGEIGDFLKG
ncbi:DUF4252 domain-containing protein [Eudoraea chungangensis]|uniref:DUF4252 domain-containing protein n=1 Tax=Eudoraea chungangensis TaxID=1481905 RepID=UPI0023EC805D|nr:DUF4252 domain-containing protein [Eudoraea chungangensis]